MNKVDYNFTELNDLVPILIKSIDENNKLVISIDGGYGVGKTHLSYCLACEVGKKEKYLSVINIDDYIRYEQAQNFIDMLDIELLKYRIKNKNFAFIIEGVCMLELLKKLEISKYIHIYCKNINDKGEWRDKEDLDFNNNEAVYQMKRKEASKSKCKTNIIDYHWNYEPHKYYNYSVKIQNPY